MSSTVNVIVLLFLSIRYLLFSLVEILFRWLLAKDREWIIAELTRSLLQRKRTTKKGSAFFIFRWFSLFRHTPQPPANGQKRLKAPLEKDTFRPSAPSAEKSPERRLISGCPVKSGDRHIDRLIAQTNILQLTFPANSPDMNHSRRTQHAAQCLKVAALHHLMCTEISLQQHVNFHFRQFGWMKILLQLLYLN